MLLLMLVQMKNNVNTCQNASTPPEMVVVVVAGGSDGRWANEKFSEKQNEYMQFQLNGENERPHIDYARHVFPSSHTHILHSTPLHFEVEKLLEIAK